MTRKTRRRNRSQGTDLEAQPEGEDENREVSSQIGSSTRPQAQERKDDPSNSGEIDQLGDDRIPGDITQPMPSEMPRMIGDFDDNANALYDMDGVLIFAGFFSIALTSFLVDKVHDLQVDPTQQLVYYQQQNVALLAQISQQVSSIAPQVAIPSAPPPPYDFIFSVSAALLATLVQQWVRDYMYVFQRYSNPLKIARLRQYLCEGAEGWYMPVVAESVPCIVHVSLFLFFLGLGDSLLAVHTTVAITTIVPITICGFLYVVQHQKVHPRSYLNRASDGSLKAVSQNISEAQIQLAMEESDERKDRDVRSIRWLIHQRTEDDEMELLVMAIPGAFTSKWGVNVWRKSDHASDADLHMSVIPHHRSPHFQRTYPLGFLRPLGRIAGTQMTNETPHDITVTQLLPRLPINVQLPDDPYAHRDPSIYDLCTRIRHLIATCDNRSVFTNQELWLKRARGCVETAASLIVCADIKPGLFGDLGRLLYSLRQITGHYTELGSDGLFVSRWTCLSIVVVNRGMTNHDEIKLAARVAIDALSRFGMEDDDEETSNGDDDENALRNARRIDDYFENARQFCLHGLRGALRPSEAGMAEDQVREILARDHEDDISMLERIVLAADRVANIDGAIFEVNDSICASASGLISFVHGVIFDQFEPTGLAQETRFFNPTIESTGFLPQFVFLHQRLRLLCSYSSKLRDIIDGQVNGTYKEVLESLGTLWKGSDDPRCKRSVIHQRHLMERQLLRLQDLRDGGGFGFGVELFFLVAHQLLTIPLSPDVHSSLIVGTFRTITSNWRQHKHSIGTQRVVLNLVCDLAILDRGLLSNLAFPGYITDELLALLENMVEGQSGSHIDDAIKELDSAIEEQDVVQAPERSTEVHLFRAEAVKVISRLRLHVPSYIE
ncbi:hypothetical protein H4582DRAFT_2076034 [Lactarius indigo]|nr:hypothetical protein H4582DRAFT_2076034 [Lactarius indigo]